MRKETLASVPPKPMVEGGRAFGEEGWKPARFELAFIIISFHGKKDAYILVFFVDSLFII